MEKQFKKIKTKVLFFEYLKPLHLHSQSKTGCFSREENKGFKKVEIKKLK